MVSGEMETLFKTLISYISNNFKYLNMESNYSIHVSILLAYIYFTLLNFNSTLIIIFNLIFIKVLLVINFILKAGNKANLISHQSCAL
jgi:hypothetical protein